MNPLSTPAATAPPDSTPHRALAHWSAIQFALFTTTLGVLGAAIGWPGILREPAGVVLPTIHGAALATSVGYFSYLLASVALIGLALSLRRTLQPYVGGLGLDMLTVLGAAAGVLKTLGIVRWLTVMPVLAEAYVSPDTSAALRPALELAYTSMNAYAGGVGEMLGVQLFGGLWMAGISVLLWRQGWRVSGALGAVSGAMFVLINFRVFYDDIGMLNAIAGPLGLAWYAVLAVAAWRQRQSAVPSR